MRQWVSRDLGINFDQRNALVVGIAMGFAVIPTIFSITEDAIFSVPKHLTQGSLALGATPWQTLTRVVIPTASPGIFSAVMIGMGRAVGETMIVLMATGNTPIMDMNIFEGMRTLAANIAVEMPESEVGGSHFRILFLAALVLFAFTFMVNTLAEVVRQRLRQKYGSL
jgi:phosphate transport system permease protein